VPIDELIDELERNGAGFVERDGIEDMAQRCST